MSTTGSPSQEYIIIVRGVARSKYARSAPKWEQHVNEEAQRCFAQPLRERNLSVDIRHFYTSGNSVNLDNLLKSILDGLKSAAYQDDTQIAQVSARRYNRSVSYDVKDLRREEVEPFVEGRDFVSIAISHLEEET